MGFLNSHESSRIFTKKKQMTERIIYKDLSYKIVGLAIEVYNELGFGFLENVYENALMVWLHRAGIKAKQQAPVKVKFQGTIVGDYLVDILVEEKIILELKSSESIVDAHVAQVLNYLKATKLKLGIVLNFGKEKLEYKRIVL